MSIIEVILSWAGMYRVFTPAASAIPGDALIGLIVFGIIAIILCIVVLSSFNVLSTSLKVEPNWLVLLIFGILILLFGGTIGGILIIIGAIIGIVDAA